MPINKFIATAYKKIVIVNMRVILTFLCLIAFLSTCTLMCDISETTFFIDDSSAKNGLIILLFVALLFWLRKIKWGKRIVFLFFILAFSLIWVFVTRYTPRSDQMAIFAGVEALYNGEYSLFGPTSYFMKNPQQYGLVLIYYLCSKVVFGNYVLTYQILNALAVVCFYKKLGDVCTHVGLEKKYQTILSLIGLIFFPLVMYTSFLYGTLLGLAFAVMAIDYEILFFEKGGIKYGVLAAVLAALAIVAKTNFLIFVIAMLIYAAIELLQKIDAIKAGFLALMVILLVTVPGLPGKIVGNITGIPEADSISAYAFIAMGLQEGPRANGWHNGFDNDSFVDNNYSTEAQKEVAISEIKDRINIFRNDHEYAVEFFLLKLASQWNNPTFECFWINQVCDADIEQSDFIKGIMSKEGSAKAYGFLDAFMLVVLLGALAAFWLEDKFEVKMLTLATVFIGGFIFHIFWEAKGQYTLPYFVLLFPYAIRGYEVLTEKLVALREKILTGDFKSVDYIRIIQFVCVLVLILLVIGDKIGALSKDTEAWIQYLEM